MNRHTPLAAACAALLLSGCTTTMRDMQASAQLLRKDRQGIEWMQQQLAEKPGDMVLRARYLQELQHETLRLLALARQAYDGGNPDQARQYLERLLRLSPGNDEAQGMLRWMDRQSEAEGMLAQAVSLIPTRPDEALRLLDEALKLQPANLEAQRMRDTLAATRSADFAPQLSERLDERISVQFQNQPLISVFDLVSRITGLSFAFDGEVEQSKPVTIYANDTPVRQVLDMILRSNQLESQPVGGTSVMVFPARPDKASEYRDLEMRVFNLNYASAGQALAMLKQMVKTNDVYVDERTNMVVMRDRPEAIAVAERLIASLDVPQSEVMLDVQVLEVSANDLLDLGLGYPSVIGASPVSQSLPGAPAGTLTLEELRRINSGDILVNLGNPTVSLDMLQRTGRVRSLANPRIRVRNREKGHVLIGDRIPVVTTTLSESFSTENVSYQDVGLSLTVEPTIGGDDEVQVKLTLEASAIADTIQTTTGLVVYRIGTRNAETLMTVRNNQTQALGGLLQRNDASTNSGLPGLSRIPVLGRLFGTLLNDRRQTEVVLLMTPHIVRRPPRMPASLLRFASGTEQKIGLDPRGQAGGSAIVPANGSYISPPPLLPPSAALGGGQEQAAPQPPRAPVVPQVHTQRQPPAQVIGVPDETVETVEPLPEPIPESRP